MANANREGDPITNLEESKVLSVVPGKTDKELAEEFKLKLAKSYENVLVILDEMHKHGFESQSGLGMGPLGKHVIVNLTIFKKFA